MRTIVPPAEASPRVRYTTIQLKRLITSTITSDTAAIDLFGAVAVAGQVTFQ